MALVGIELETIVSEPDALTTRPLNFTLTNQNINAIILKLKFDQSVCMSFDFGFTFI